MALGLSPESAAAAPTAAPPVPTPSPCSAESPPDGFSTFTSAEGVSSSQVLPVLSALRPNFEKKPPRTGFSMEPETSGASETSWAEASPLVWWRWNLLRKPDWPSPLWPVHARALWQICGHDSPRTSTGQRQLVQCIHIIQPRYAMKPICHLHLLQPTSKSTFRPKSHLLIHQPSLRSPQRPPQSAHGPRCWKRNLPRRVHASAASP